MKNRTQEIRNFIIQNVNRFPRNIAKRTSNEFSISRQAVNQHLNKLIDAQVLDAEGVTMNQSYRLRTTIWRKRYPLDGQLAEDVVWRNDIEFLLDDLELCPKVVRDGG